MAISLALTIGRLGGVFGTNMVAILLESSCELTFSIAGVIILGKMIFNFLTTVHQINYVFFVGCAILTFFLPNIFKAKKSDKPPPPPEE